MSRRKAAPKPTETPADYTFEPTAPGQLFRSIPGETPQEIKRRMRLCMLGLRAWVRGVDEDDDEAFEEAIEAAAPEFDGCDGSIKVGERMALKLFRLGQAFDPGWTQHGDTVRAIGALTLVSQGISGEGWYSDKLKGKKLRAKLLCNVLPLRKAIAQGLHEIRGD